MKKYDDNEKTVFMFYIFSIIISTIYLLIKYI